MVNSSRAIYCSQIESVSGMIYSLPVHSLPHRRGRTYKIHERIMPYASPFHPSTLPPFHPEQPRNVGIAIDTYKAVSPFLDSTAFCCLTTDATILPGPSSPPWLPLPPAPLPPHLPPLAFIPHAILKPRQLAVGVVARDDEGVRQFQPGFVVIRLVGLSRI